MNAHDILMYGHLWVLKHVDDLTPEEWGHPNVCGYWSCKDILAHLASFEWLLTEVMGSFTGSAPTPLFDRYVSMNGDAFNADQVGQRKAQKASEVMMEYKSAYEKVMAALAQLNADQLHLPGTLPWYGAQYALDDFIVYQYYGHKREHMSQVAVYKDTLKR